MESYLQQPFKYLLNVNKYIYIYIYYINTIKFKSMTYVL